MNDTETSNLYSIFLNSMGVIVNHFEGTVIKNIGDALLFYFPKTNPRNLESFKKVIECCLTMCASHDKITEKLREHGLPSVDYKISATYGPVRIASTSTSAVNDIFGSTVNRCAKINGIAPRNGLIIGEAFYNAVKTLDEYSFSRMDQTMPDHEQGYVVYIVSRK